MTYRQIFDEAIGGAPVSTVDVDRVIDRQRRASRLRRMGIAGGGAVAVLAVALATGLLARSAPEVGPSPATTASPAPVTTTVPGTKEDRVRLDRAVLTALAREVPNFVWARSGHAGATPNWTGQGGDQDETNSYWGQGNGQVGAIRGHFSVQIERDGLRIWQMRPCVAGRAGATSTCVENTGPDGEKIRVESTVFERPNPRPEKVRRVMQEVRVLRPDGTLIRVTASGDSGNPPPLTAEQMTGIALDPAVALAPPRTGSSTP